MTAAARSESGLARARDGVWWAGLGVACAAAVATAHGLYAVAAASDVPWPIAALYPLMTDGLALVAYSATGRLTDAGRRYAWSVVVLAAGLSGVAQAVHLAGGGMHDAGAAVRFGIGAAPALAAAAVAHLLHLIRTAAATVRPTPVQPEALEPRPEPVQADAVQVRPVVPAVRPDRPAPMRRVGWRDGAPAAADRAKAAAVRYRTDRGALPTVTVLVGLADVSRGTAGTVLKGLRTPADDKSPAPATDDTEPAPADHPTLSEDKIQNHHTPRHHDPEEDQLPASRGR